MLKKILVLFTIGCFCSDLNALKISNADGTVPGSHEIVYKVTNESDKKIDVQLRVEKRENDSWGETDEIWVKASPSFKVGPRKTESVKVSVLGLEASGKSREFRLIATSPNDPTRQKDVILIAPADIDASFRNTVENSKRIAATPAE